MDVQWPDVWKCSNFHNFGSVTGCRKSGKVRMSGASRGSGHPEKTGRPVSLGQLGDAILGGKSGFRGQISRDLTDGKMGNEGEF